MSGLQITLTVFFEDPFWVGVFERFDNQGVSVAKVTFGAEPTDPEVQEFILTRFSSLRFSPPLEAKPKSKHNPKRMQREAKLAVAKTGVGTKSQQALKLQQEQAKAEGKAKSRQRKQEQARRLFLLKQQQKKEKHRGR